MPKNAIILPSNSKGKHVINHDNCSGNMAKESDILK